MSQGSRSHLVFVVAILSVVTSFLFVLPRLVARIAILRSPSWDDFFIVLASVLAFGLSFSICFATHHGLGSRDADISPELHESLARSQYVFTVLYNPALMALKSSILIFYLSLSKTTPRVFRHVTIMTLIVVNVGGFILTVLNIDQCRPLHFVFEYPLQPTKCVDILRLYFSAAPLNIITDLAIFSLPIPILTGLRLPRRQKIILVGVFGLGVFVVIVDVLRIACLEQSVRGTVGQHQSTQNGTVSSSTRYVDFAWSASLSFMWSAIEVNVGIICACIPTLKPLVSRISPRLLLGKGDSTEKAGISTQPPPSGSPHLAATTTIDFITTPEMVNSPGNLRAASITDATNSKKDIVFGFVEFETPQSLLDLSNLKSVLTLIPVILLSIVLGSAYGLLFTLNCHFLQQVELSVARMQVLHSSYYWGYLIGPLTFSPIILKKGGFKASFVSGLFIYTCGILIFWPCAVLASYPAFIVSNFIIGLGMATIEIALNPFVTLCGPPEDAEIRLNIVHGFEAVGRAIPPIFSHRLLSAQVTHNALIPAQWSYLGIALLCSLSILGVYYSPIPTATDEDLHNAASRLPFDNTEKIGSVRVTYITLAVGVVSMFCFIGGQESVTLMTFRAQPPPHSANSIIRNISRGCFAAGRFLAAFLFLAIKPRKVLLFYLVGCIVTAALAMNLIGESGQVIVVLQFLFQSAVQPTATAICLRSLGSYTKTGSAFLTAATAGGAIFPVIMDAIVVKRDLYAWCVMVAAFSFAFIFPTYLNAVPAAKRQVDPYRGKRAIFRRPG